MATGGTAISDAGEIRLPTGEASIYGQFCPNAMAAESLATRWTMVVLGEMLSGRTRFNEIRRGVPRMSSAGMGISTFEDELEASLIELDGDPRCPPASRNGSTEAASSQTFSGL